MKLGGTFETHFIFLKLHILCMHENEKLNLRNASKKAEIPQVVPCHIAGGPHKRTMYAEEFRSKEMRAIPKPEHPGLQHVEITCAPLPRSLRRVWSMSAPLACKTNVRIPGYLDYDDRCEESNQINSIQY